MNDLIYKFCDLGFKVNKDTANLQERTVEGYFTDDKIDLYGHVILKSATVGATKSYADWGNIREQHGAPVGSVVEIGKKAWNHVKVRIADDKTWNLAIQGVYKGFSIGALVLDLEFKDVKEFGSEMFDGLPSGIAKVIKEMGEIIVIKAIEIVEISLVDRPANPRAVLLQAGMSGSSPKIQKQLDDYHVRLSKLLEVDMEEKELVENTNEEPEAEIVENEAGDDNVTDTDVLQLMVEVLTDMSETLNKVLDGINTLQNSVAGQSEAIQNGIVEKLSKDFKLVTIQERKGNVSDNVTHKENMSRVDLLKALTNRAVKNAGLEIAGEE